VSHFLTKIQGKIGCKEKERIGHVQFNLGTKRKGNPEKEKRKEKNVEFESLTPRHRIPVRSIHPGS